MTNGTIACAMNIEVENIARQHRVQVVATTGGGTPPLSAPVSDPEAQGVQMIPMAYTPQPQECTGLRATSSRALSAYCHGAVACPTRCSHAT